MVVILNIMTHYCMILFGFRILQKTHNMLSSDVHSVDKTSKISKQAAEIWAEVKALVHCCANGILLWLRFWNINFHFSSGEIYIFLFNLADTSHF